MNYSEGKIYCISNDDLYYIGSTIQPVKARLRGHKNDYNQFLKGVGHYRSSYELIKTENYIIKNIEIYPCNSKLELEKREYEIIKEYKALYGDKCVNIIGVQTPEEYAEKGRVRANTYYSNNKEICNEKNKQFYYKNKEKRLAYVKDYREKNHAKIMEKMLTPVTCECGITVTKCNLTRHKKSKRHLDNTI